MLLQLFNYNNFQQIDKIYSQQTFLVLDYLFNFLFLLNFKKNLNLKKFLKILNSQKNY